MGSMEHQSMVDDDTLSSCCNSKIWASLADGVLVGTCSKCNKPNKKLSKEGVVKTISSWEEIWSN